MPKKGFTGTIYLRYDSDANAMALWEEIEAVEGVHPQEFARRVLATALKTYADTRRIRWPVMVEFAPPLAAEQKSITGVAGGVPVASPDTNTGGPKDYPTRPAKPAPLKKGRGERR